MPTMAESSAWSISGVSENNESYSILNKSHSIIQSFERVSWKIKILLQL